MSTKTDVENGGGAMPLNPSMVENPELRCSFIRKVLFPLDKLSQMIYGCVASMVFCGFIIYDTNKLIKRFSYDEHIWASVSLYVDIINLFVSLLIAFRAAE